MFYDYRIYQYRNVVLMRNTDFHYDRLYFWYIVFDAIIIKKNYVVLVEEFVSIPETKPEPKPETQVLLILLSSSKFIVREQVSQNTSFVQPTPQKRFDT